MKIEDLLEILISYLVKILIFGFIYKVNPNLGYALLVYEANNTYLMYKKVKAVKEALKSFKVTEITDGVIQLEEKDDKNEK